MASKQALGRAVRAARKSAGLSQDDLTLVTARSFISAIERGAKSPTVDKLSEICSVLGFSPAAVLGAASIIERGSKSAEGATALSEQIEQIVKEDAVQAAGG
jgi:transcriptional regulator with XRE-family HTH domain